MSITIGQANILEFLYYLKSHLTVALQYKDWQEVTNLRDKIDDYVRAMSKYQKAFDEVQEINRAIRQVREILENIEQQADIIGDVLLKFEKGGSNGTNIR